MRYDILGIVRFALALLVMLYHLWPGAIPCAGHFAVIGFFCLSGFLVCKAAHEYYADRPWAFLANRALRIYPAVFLVTSLVLLVNAKLALAWPITAKDWLVQFAVFGQYMNVFGPPDVQHEYIPRIIGPVWSLNVELYFYLVIGLVTYRSARLSAALTVLFLCVGIASALRLIPITFYGNPIGNGFTFFSGAWIYFVTRNYSLRPFYFYAAFGLFIASAVGIQFIIAQPERMDMLHFLPWGLTLIMLLALPETKTQTYMQSLLRALGDMSYPLFLVHMPVAEAMGRFYTQGSQNHIIGTIFISLALSLLISALLRFCFSGLRSDIRQAQKETGALPPPPIRM